MLVSLPIHLCIFLQHTGCNVPSPLHSSIWSGRNAFLTAQTCAAKQADSYVLERLCGVQCLITNALQHCQNKMLSSLPGVALQNRVTSCWCHYQYTYISSTYRFQCPITTAQQHRSGRNAFLIAHTCAAKQADSYVVERLCGVQCLITNALQHKSEQNAFLIARSCSAKQADSIVVSHHQCTTALVKTKCFPHSPDLHCKTG